MTTVGQKDILRQKFLEKKKKGQVDYPGGINSPGISFDFLLKNDRLQLRLNSDYKGGKDETEYSH